jgi:hypothetical protein
VEVAAKLTLFVGCLMIAMVAGWALGRVVGVLDPAFAGLPPGFEHLHDAVHEAR